MEFNKKTSAEIIFFQCILAMLCRLGTETTLLLFRQLGLKERFQHCFLTDVVNYILTLFSVIDILILAMYVFVSSCNQKRLFP